MSKLDFEKKYYFDYAESESVNSDIDFKEQREKRKAEKERVEYRKKNRKKNKKKNIRTKVRSKLPKMSKKMRRKYEEWVRKSNFKHKDYKLKFGKARKPRPSFTSIYLN